MAVVRAAVERRRSPGVRAAVLLAFVVALSLLGIFDHELWTPDEPRAAELGRAFLDGGSWSVPTLNGAPFIEKPPLFYWMVAASLRVFGVHAWAARIPCVLLGWGTLLLAWHLGIRLHGREAGGSAVLVLATTWGFVHRTHHAETDTALLFFVTACAYFLWRAFTGDARWYLAAYAAGVGAFFSKGFIGFVFPALLAAGWIAWNRAPRELLRARLWLGAAIVAAPIALWLWSVAEHPAGDLLRRFLVDNHLRRFSPEGPSFELGHVRPFYYYLYEFPATALPWSLALPFAVPWIVRRLREPSERFLLSWFVPGFVFLNLSGTKRGVYLVPLLPPVALLVAEWLRATGRRGWLRGGAAAVGVLLLAATVFAVPRVDREKSMRPFSEAVGRLTASGIELYGWLGDETTRAVIPFYTGRNFENLVTERRLEEVSRRAGPVAVVGQDGDRSLPGFRTALRYFPHVWLEKEHGSGRRMWLVANVPRPEDAPPVP